MIIVIVGFKIKNYSMQVDITFAISTLYDKDSNNMDRTDSFDFLITRSSDRKKI